MLDAPDEDLNGNNHQAIPESACSSSTKAATSSTHARSCYIKLVLRDGPPLIWQSRKSL